MRIHDRGFALILVLVAAAGLFALAMQAALLSRAGSIESRVLVERTAHERGATSALSMVLRGLTTSVERFAAQSGQTSGSVSSGDGGGEVGGEDERPRIELPQIIKDMLGEQADELEDEAKKSIGVPEGGGITGRSGARGPKSRVVLKSLPAEPVMVRLEDGGAMYAVSLMDASGLLNVNVADRDQLVKFFLLKGFEADEAGSMSSQILDWRDEDDFAGPGGAESAAYRAKGVRCRNAPFESVEELRYLPAFDAEAFERIRLDVTVSGDGRMHVGTAPRDALLSIPGMTEEVADGLIAARRERHLEENDLDRLIPLHAREARDWLVVLPSSVLRVRVEVVGDSKLRYEGLAVVSEGGVRAVGLRPVL